MKLVKVWLCRDSNQGSRSLYAIHGHLTPKPVLGRDEKWDQAGRASILDICPENFQRLFPHFKLKPGDGPRRVEITAKFVD